MVYTINADGRSFDAIPGEDYEFPNITQSSPYFNFTISPGATRSFDITIIDDNVAENRHHYYYYYYYYHDFDELIAYEIGVYASNQRESCGYFHLYISDNEGIYCSYAEISI